jgi:hypothetical protein
MNYSDWLGLAPQELTQDSLWKMETCRLPLFLGDIAGIDVTNHMALP